MLGPYRDRGRWFDRFESEKRGHASGADAGKGAKHVLEFTSVNDGNVEQDVVGSPRPMSGGKRATCLN